MSKYDPLLKHLSRSQGAIDLRFRDIEAILGFPLPGSARRHAAWWSNSGGTHVQSDAWQGAGYKTEDVDLERETVRFVADRMGFGEMKQPEIKQDPPPQQPTAAKPKHHPAYGALKGMITLLPNVDYTAPADPEWGKVYED